MTNVRCRCSKEIDLLAVNPKTGEKYHVESRVGTPRGFKIREKDTHTSKGRPHKIGLDYFHKEKFEHAIVKEKIHEFFGDSEYHKWLVVWHVQNKGIIGRALQEYDIEIYWLHELINNLRNQRLTSGSRDDVLRLIEFFGKEELMTQNLRIIDLKRDRFEEEKQ